MFRHTRSIRDEKNARCCGRFFSLFAKEYQKHGRFYAFLLHLLGSCIVALISAGLIFLLWYPGLIAYASGVRDIYFLLLIVDVALGPIITLVIFNREKKSRTELGRDVALVIVLQMAALFYGMHTVYIARPVYMVYNAGRFDLVYANDISLENRKKAERKEYRDFPVFGFLLVAAVLPEDIKSRNELLFNSLSGGDDLAKLPNYYVPYSNQKRDVIQRSDPLSNLTQLNIGSQSRIDALLKKYTHEKAGIGYLPLKGRTHDLAILVSRESGDILELVDLAPWK